MSEDVETQKVAAECDAFIEKYRVRGGNKYDPKTGKTMVPVTWGGQPEKSLMVRMLEQAGVLSLMSSFLSGGVKTMDIIGVIWLDYPYVIKLSLLDFFVDMSSPTPPRWIHIISGLHRTTALQRCHAMYKLKPPYQILPLILLLVPRTRNTIQTLLFIGNADNKKSQTVVKTTQWSVVLQYRRQLEDIQEDPELTTTSMKEKAFTAYKKSTAPHIPFENNTLHTFSAIASVDASVFAIMSRVFAGEFVVKKELKGQKKPEALTHFTSMSGIPSHYLVTWMQRILDGEWLTKQFQKRCQIYTKNVRVAGQLIEHMQILRPLYDFTSIEGIAVKYPVVKDEKWFDAVVSSCDEAMKAKLSTHATKMIVDMVALQEKQDLETKVSEVLFV